MRARQLTLDDVYFNLKPWPLVNCDKAVKVNAGVIGLSCIHFSGWVYHSDQYFRDNLGLQLTQTTKIVIRNNLQKKLNDHLYKLKPFLCEQ